MAYEVIATAEFGVLLDEAVSFRVDNYGLRSARRLLDNVDKVRELLSQTPCMGALVDDSVSEGERTGLRWVRMDSYIVVYRVRQDRQEAVLLKLFHGSSNWRRRVL